MELSGLKIKNFKRGLSSSKYIKNPTLKTFHIFREMELSSPKKLVGWILTDVTS